LLGATAILAAKNRGYFDIEINFVITTGDLGAYRFCERAKLKSVAYTKVTITAPTHEEAK